MEDIKVLKPYGTPRQIIVKLLPGGLLCLSNGDEDGYNRDGYNNSREI